MQSIDPQGQQNFDNSLDILLLKMLLQLSFMLLDDGFADEFGAFYSSLIDDDFVMLTQLDLIVFDCLVQGVVLVTSLLDVVDNLKEVDGDRENLSARLQNFLIFFELGLVLSLQLQLVLRLVGGALEDSFQFCLARVSRVFLDGCIALNFSCDTFFLTSSSKSSRELLSSQYLRYSLT